ncbi:MAG TPA: TonB-dependent receptor [Firmicutes bacterium]|nr:TonB-dependent receptor [Bacillota bacterium]
MKHLLVAVVLVLAVTQAVFADMRDTTYVLDPILVTATRTETERRNVPGSVTVLSAERLLATGATDVLSAVAVASPGVFITENGPSGFGLGDGSAGSITIRGVGGGTPNDQVLVMVNGQPDYTGLFGHPLPDAYALNEVERVEIVRGPASALYGSGAMGGVINVITRQATKPGDRITLRTDAGPWNTINGEMSALGRHGAFDYRVSASHTRTDGHRDDAAFERSHVSGDLAWNAGAWTIRTSGATTPFSGSDPGPTYGVAGMDIDVTRNRGSVGVEYDGRWFATEGMFYRSWGEHDFTNGWHSTDYVEGATAQFDYHVIGEGTISTAIDYRRYGGEAEDTSTNPVYDYGSHESSEFSATLSAVLPIGDRLSLVGAARAQNHSEVGWTFSPEAGMSVHITKTLTIRGSASRGFRSPSMRDMALFPASNTDVKPEEVTNIETGAQWKPLDWLATEVSVFRTTGDNLVVLKTPPPPPPRFVNTGSFTNSGVEAEARWMLSRLHGSLSVSRHEIGKTINTDGGIPVAVIGAPKTTVGFSLGTRVERVRLTVNYRYIAGMYGPDSNDADSLPDRLDDYGVLMLSASRPVFSYLSASVTLRNVLDTKYETMTGYPMPGFHATVGLSATLER